MNFNFNEFVEKLEEGGEKALTKGRAAKDILSLKGQISSCEDVINRSYSALGRKYFEKFKDNNEDPDFSKFIKDILNAENAIKELEGKIEDIKSNS